MVYDLDGNAVSALYNIDSERLQYAYDVNGNIVFSDGPIPESFELTIMTYNPQWFTGINSQLAMLQDIFSTYDADIIGFQEYYKTTTIPSVAEQALVNYQYKYKSSLSTNPNGIASKTEGNVQNVQYSYRDDETWQYQKAYFTFNNKVIAFYNTHLTWRYDAASEEGRRLQAAELFADAQNEEYVIITGDFNSYARNTSGADYINIFKQFVDAGYHLANASARSGFTGTYCGRTTATSLADMESPCDNIIVSGNIDIIRTWFDLTKLSYLNGDYIDHIPVISKLRVY